MQWSAFYSQFLCHLLTSLLDDCFFNLLGSVDRCHVSSFLSFLGSGFCANVSHDFAQRRGSLPDGIPVPVCIRQFSGAMPIQKQLSDVRLMTAAACTAKKKVRRLMPLAFF